MIGQQWSKQVGEHGCVLKQCWRGFLSEKLKPLGYWSTPMRSNRWQHSHIPTTSISCGTQQLVGFKSASTKKKGDVSQMRVHQGRLTENLMELRYFNCWRMWADIRRMWDFRLISGFMHFTLLENCPILKQT